MSSGNQYLQNIKNVFCCFYREILILNENRINSLCFVLLNQLISLFSGGG